MLKTTSSVSTALLMTVVMTLIGSNIALADSASSSSSSSTTTPTETKTVTVQATSTSATPANPAVTNIVTTTTVVDASGKSITTVSGTAVPISQVTAPSVPAIPPIVISN